MGYPGERRVQGVRPPFILAQVFRLALVGGGVDAGLGAIDGGQGGIGIGSGGQLLVGLLQSQGNASLIYLGERESFGADSIRWGSKYSLARTLVRASVELERSKIQVIDCSLLPSGICVAGQNTLKKLGFRVALYGGAD